MEMKREKMFGKSNAKRDAIRDSGGDDKCKHPAPWNSVGPLYDDQGKSYVQYSCNECGSNLRRHYYDK